MGTRGQILINHYLTLIRRAGVWLGISSILATVVTAAPAFAVGVQMGQRSATLSSAVANAAGVTSTFVFKPGSASTLVKGIRFQICTSPLETTSCTAPAAGSMAAATAGSQTGTGVTNQYGSPAYTGATDVLFSNGSGNTLTSGNAITFPVAAIHNPSALGSFYLRITTYTDTGGTAEVDFGAVAVSTASQIAVSANVQESITFCVYTGANCGAGGTTVSVGTGADNVLSSTTPSGGVSYMDASTNGATGYVISYNAANLSSSSDTITAAGGSATAFSSGTALFGINLAANSTPAIGAAPAAVTGTHGQAASAAFTTADQVSFVPATTTTAANSNSLPDGTYKYTVSYIAQAGITSKPGAFSTTFNWICTGTF